MLHKDFRSRLKSLSRLALLQEISETYVFEDIPEPVIRIARYPAVALRDVTPSIDAHKLVGTILPPDARETCSFPTEMVHQLIEWSELDSLLVTTFHPDSGQICEEPAQPINIENALLFGIIELSTGE